MKRTIVAFAAIVIPPFLTIGCSSFQQQHDHQRRKHTYQDSLSRLRFPTTRAELYAALPPASPPQTSFISGAPFTAAEGYKLDRDFSITMSVSYAHWPFSKHTTVDDLLFRTSIPIHRNPRDTIFTASLTK